MFVDEKEDSRGEMEKVNGVDGVMIKGDRFRIDDYFHDVSFKST